MWNYVVISNFTTMKQLQWVFEDTKPREDVLYLFQGLNMRPGKKHSSTDDELNQLSNPHKWTTTNPLKKLSENFTLRDMIQIVITSISVNLYTYIYYKKTKY